MVLRFDKPISKMKYLISPFSPEMTLTYRKQSHPDPSPPREILDISYSSGATFDQCTPRMVYTPPAAISNVADLVNNELEKIYDWLTVNRL